MSGVVEFEHEDGQERKGAKERLFGAPAIGYVNCIYRRGTVLLADISQIPSKVYDLIRGGSYKRVSSEVYWDYKGRWPRVLRAVAFLGADIPAITDLQAVADLYRDGSGTVHVYTYSPVQESKMKTANQVVDERAYELSGGKPYTDDQIQHVLRSDHALARAYHENAEAEFLDSGTPEPREYGEGHNVSGAKEYQRLGAMIANAAKTPAGTVDIQALVTMLGQFPNEVELAAGFWIDKTARTMLINDGRNDGHGIMHRLGDYTKSCLQKYPAVSSMYLSSRPNADGVVAMFPQLF